MSATYRQSIAILFALLVAGCQHTPQTPEALQLDMSLEVTFEDVNDTISLPKFRPVES